MAAHRFLFYAPEAEPGDATATITGDEHHHLTRVLRIRDGDAVYATNGRGWLARCRVTSPGPDATRLVVEEADVHPAGPEIVLALALLRKERFARALEQCVELGVSRVVPFVCGGAHVRRYGVGTLDRLRRVAVAAMKQSFQPHLTAVADPVDFSALLAMVRSSDRALFGSQGAPVPAPGPALIVVGPEAGLSDEETAALAGAGAAAAGVNRHRLRSETAAVALVAALAHPD